MRADPCPALQPKVATNCSRFTTPQCGLLETHWGGNTVPYSQLWAKLDYSQGGFHCCFQKWLLRGECLQTPIPMPAEHRILAAFTGGDTSPRAPPDKHIGRAKPAQFLQHRTSQISQCDRSFRSDRTMVRRAVAISSGWGYLMHSSPRKLQAY